MKGRWILVGAVIGFAVTLTLGFAFGAGRSAPGAGRSPSPQATGDWWAAMDAMHDSPWMEQMRAQMGPELAAQCDAMHEQMREQAGQMGPGMMGGSGGMMGGSGGMMGGSGGMMGGSGQTGPGMMGW